MPQRRQGILFAAGAVLLWSASSPLTALNGQAIGAWQFLALACGIAGITQVVIYRGLKMPLKNILLPPLKLWLLVGLTFVVYSIVFTLAVVTAEKSQKVGVNLANYLWPTLTILFATVIVPGTKMTLRIFLALLLALAGVVLANIQSLQQLLHAGANLSLMPYALGLMAAITWALYSVLLVRWKSWCNRYATSPLGFLLTSTVALTVCAATRSWVPMTPAAWTGVIAMALGPQAAAYLLWELSLHRAPAHVVGILGSATPILSTLWFLLIYRFLAGANTPPNYIHCLIAAGLIASAVLLGTWSRSKNGINATVVTVSD